MEEKIAAIKEWLGTGSINIFGLPMSGKDTVGVRLAQDLGGKFLSSGMIIRATAKPEDKDAVDKGNLVATNAFYDLVLPYFEREDLWGLPLILSSVGRWSGEEMEVMVVAEGAGHPIKAAVVLNVSEADVKERWEAAQILNDRGDRVDDKDWKVFEVRLNEFREKTLPVLQHYKELGLLVEVRADMDREAVYAELINKLASFASA